MMMLDPVTCQICQQLSNSQEVLKSSWCLQSSQIPGSSWFFWIPHVLSLLMNLYFNLHQAVSCDLDRFDQTISRMSSPDKSLSHVYILMSLSLHRGLSNWVRGQVNDLVWRAWNWVTDLKAQRSPWEFSDKHGFFWLDWNNKVLEEEMQIRKVKIMHWMQSLTTVHPACTEIMLSNSSEQFFRWVW